MNNKNGLGLTWLLLTIIMVGMSLSPMVGNAYESADSAAAEYDGSAEIVDVQNEDSDESEGWIEEQKMNEQETERSVDGLNNGQLAPTETGKTGTRNTDTVEEEEQIPMTEDSETSGRVVDQACSGEFNLDPTPGTDPEIDTTGDGNFDSEVDAAPEVLGDFQTDDDFAGEYDPFNLADSKWAVHSESFSTWGPDRGQDREVVMAGQRNYPDTAFQTAYLTAGAYTLNMYDTWGDGWNGNTFLLVNQDGVSVDSASLTSYSTFGTANIDVPADGFYSSSWSTTGSWQEEVYFELEKPEYDFGLPPGGGYIPDPLPFNTGHTTYSGPVSVALAAGTYYLQMMDSYGDGWNGNTLQIHDDQGGLILDDSLDPYCNAATWPWGGTYFPSGCSTATIDLTITTNGDYTFTLGGGSWLGEISVELTPNAVSIEAPSEYFAQHNPSGTSHGAMQTTTCINAADYNQVFVGFGFHMYGTSSLYSGLALEVRAEDDPTRFNGGQWMTVWEAFGAGYPQNDVDPVGAKNGDFWFYINMEITALVCDAIDCAEKLSFRFYYDGGGSTRDDYAVDNFRLQGYGQFEDRDGDGVSDNIDDCDGADNTDGTPNGEFVHSAFDDLLIGSNGCPPDGDGDGISDVVDWCPSTPSVFAGFVDANGCEAGIAMSVGNVLYDSKNSEALSWSESFNSDQANPMATNVDDRDGWTSYEDDGPYNWQIYTLYTAGKFEGDRSIVHAEMAPDMTDEAWLITPMISIADAATAEFGNRMTFAMMIEFFAWMGTYGYNSGEFAMYASTKSCQPSVGDPSTGDYLNLLDDSDGDGVADPVYTVPYGGLPFQAWTEQMFEIPEMYWGQDTCFAFRNAAPSSGSMFIDLVQVFAQPTPPDGDNDGVWDAFPESLKDDGTPVYGAAAGTPIDICPNTPKGQMVIAMTLGADDNPIPGDQSWDVGCSAPISLPYEQHFGSLNMPAEIQFGSSDGDGILNEDTNFRAWWNYYGPCGFDCLGIVRADDFPTVRWESRYMVMPMLEVSKDYDAVFLTWWDYVSQYTEWWGAVSYHGIQVAVVNQDNDQRSCEVGLDTDGDLDGDTVLDANGNIVNSGYEELASMPNAVSYGWFEQEVSLSSYVDEWICVAFVFRSYGDQEWWIDDISMRGVVMPPDLVAPEVEEFTPYTGVNTYRADSRRVFAEFSDGQTGIDNGQAPTSTSTAPTLDYEILNTAGDVITSGAVAMTEVEACDISILPYYDRSCSFEGWLPELSAPGQTMSYTLTFQDIGFKTDNDLTHPVTSAATACMSRADFDANLAEFEPSVPADAIPAADVDPVCGGPNSIMLGPYHYTLLDPAAASPTDSMMNIGLSGVTNTNGNTYDVHVTFFDDTQEYVVEYSDGCTSDGWAGLSHNGWLDDDDMVSLGAQVDNILASAGSCGSNAVYAYDSASNVWMSAALGSGGIDYNHNGLDSGPREWADSTPLPSSVDDWHVIKDIPSALTDVNDIKSGSFGIHTFAEPSTSFDVLVGTDAAMGDYLTDASGMTLYIFWDDTPGADPTSACGAGCIDIWPAFYGGAHPNVDPTLDNDDFDSFTRDDGTLQSTYQGWPLYTYAMDNFPGDENGVSVANWYAAGNGNEGGPGGTSCTSSLSGQAPMTFSATLCEGDFTLNMADSYGDGWNGNYFTITDSSGNQLWSVTCCGANGGSGWGSSGSAVFSNPSVTDVTITIGGGSWQGEVSWDFGSEAAGYSLAGSGYGGPVAADVPAGWYQLAMSDSWGDGWNGNQWTLTDANGVVVAGPFTLDYGTYGTVNFELAADCNGCTAVSEGGSWIGEISWVLSASEVPIDTFADADPFPGRMDASPGYGVGEFGVYVFPAGDYTIIETDTYGDGWNGNYLQLKNSDGAVIVSETLEMGRNGVDTFTLDSEQALSLGVGGGSWIYEVGWALSLDGYMPSGEHLTQICITSNGVIAFTDGDDCTSSTAITSLYGFNGIIYEDDDTAISAGEVYVQVQNILPQKILDFSPDSGINDGAGNRIADAWAHTILEDTTSGASLSLDLSEMHTANPGHYFEVMSAADAAALDNCNYNLYFSSVSDGDSAGDTDLGFAVIPDATTNAPADEVDYLQEGGIHQGTDGACGLTVSLMEEGYEHDSVMLGMSIDNTPEERPDYTFTGEIDFELVDTVLPGTLVPSNVEVTNNDDGVASQNGAMYDHGHSAEVCFTTDDYADSGCYYTAMLVDPPAPGAVTSVQGQVVISDTTNNVMTSLEIMTCDTPTMPGDTNNQATCVPDGSRAASLNGVTREGDRVTPYTYDDTHSTTLEQFNNANDEKVYDERPTRVSFGAAGSVPSFAPSLMAVGLVGLFAAALIQSSRREEEEEELVENETAVSPVIATILMVAITVVLSGVIYVWANQLASTSTKVTPLLTFDADAITMDDGTMYWQIVVTTAETPLALQALYVQVEFINDQCPDGYCIITQTIAEPQSYGFTPYNSDSFVTYLDSVDCTAGEGTDGCVAEFSASDVLRINFEHPDYGLIDEAIIQVAYATGNEAHVLAEFDAQSNPPGIK